jgi:hypothetical protein
MTALRNSVIEETSARVRIVRVMREQAKWWNQRKQADDTVVFCGWYWVRDNEEAGPFGTRSACIRDAFYRFVLQRDAPAVGHALAYPVEVARIKRRRRA